MRISVQSSERSRESMVEIVLLLTASRRYYVVKSGNCLGVSIGVCCWLEALVLSINDDVEIVFDSFFEISGFIAQASSCLNENQIPTDLSISLEDLGNCGIPPLNFCVQVAYPEMRL